MVDADLSGYFDSIPHGELMRSVARRVSDKQAWETLRSVITTITKQGANLLDAATPHLRLATQ